VAYWVLADLQARISEEASLQILDDDHDGSVDDEPLARLQADSDSYVNGFLRGIYDLDAVAADPPNEVVRLSLDVAEWMLAKRWPRYVSGDWRQKREDCRLELMDLRMGKTRLDVVGTPEPAANVGGSVTVPEAVEDEDVVQLFTFGTTGDF
jgi:phage gp36-like protein